MAYIGKKPQQAGQPTARPVQATAAAARVKEVIQRSTEKRAGLAQVAAASGAKGLTKAGLQALLDTAVAEASSPNRLMVTQREFGYLKKRLVASAPDDMASFLRYALVYWSTLATQNHTASLRSTDKAVIHKTLPAAPHFHTLTYWYPYFLRAYQNHKAGQATERHDPRAVDMAGDVQRVTKELQRSLADAAQLRNRIALMPRTRPAPATRPAAPRPRQEQQAGNSELPAWKE